jgi:hypothetical protein
MDDDLLKLEAELKALRPAAPTRDFLARLERELTPPVPLAASAQRTSRAWWLAAAALPIAAAMALLLVVSSRREQPAAVASNAIAGTRQPAPESFKPVAAENILVAARDEGLITLDDGTPARRERFNYVDTITWKNPRTNASVRWSVPREEVRVVPVVFQ